MPATATKNEARITHAAVKVNGTLLEAAVMDKMVEISVDSTLFVPDMAVMTFHDDKLELVDSDTFPLGAILEIETSDRDNPRETKPLFKGEIVAIEPDFSSGALATLTVRAYTKGHRMHRETKTKAWLSVTDSDIAQQIASTHGLLTEIESTTEVFKHVFQNALSDFAFLHQRAERIGYEVFIRDDKLHFRKQNPTGSAVQLELGIDLHAFRPRLTIADQVNEVTVKGWDIKLKQAIIGKASTSSTAPEIGLGKWGGQAAQSALSAAKKLQSRQVVQSQADAQAIAEAILNDINSSFIEAEGEAEGHSELRAGMLVDLKKLGTKFSGKYKITAVRHVYSTEGSFKSFFVVEGHRPRSLSYLLREQENSSWTGVVTAIVTNNSMTSDGNAPGDYGIVKIKYPWLDDSQESFWARLAIPGGGDQRGLYLMPEVNDEVLVAFEHGDFNRPYIIGGLYNGTDKPPIAIGQVVASGKVKTRIFKTRTGHTLRFVDQDSGEEYIEIVDAKSNTQIKMDTQNKKIEVVSKGDIAITAEGNISMEAKGAIDIKATRGVTVQGQTVDITAQSTANVKANAKLALQGATFSAQGSSIAEVKAGAALNLQGAIVKIN